MSSTFLTHLCVCVCEPSITISLASLLSAYDEKVAERNSDVARIAANLMMSLDDDEVTENDGDICSQFDYVLWCGDLNYRVDLSRGETQAMLDKADYMVRDSWADWLEYMHGLWV